MANGEALVKQERGFLSYGAGQQQPLLSAQPKGPMTCKKGTFLPCDSSAQFSENLKLPDHRRKVTSSLPPTCLQKTKAPIITKTPSTAEV